MATLTRSLRLAITALALACFVFGAVAHAESAADPKAAPVNINKAGVPELSTLPGIGAKKAQAIIDYRKANGDFKRVDDLINVKGIGPKTLEKLRPLLTVAALHREAPRMPTPRLA